MSVVPYARPADPSSRQWVELMQPAVELAKAVAGTDFVPKAMRDNPAAITAAILYGDEVGLGPMQSLAKIAVIDGKPSLAAEAQRALILAAGHDLWIEENTTTRCTVAGRRRDSDSTSRVTWTMDDAKRANLAGKNNWRSYPRAMLLARASAELARAVFADAIGGLAATEELETLGDDNGQPPTVEEIKPTTRRRRKTTTPAAATVSAPAHAAEPELPPLPDEEQPPPNPASEAQRRKLHTMFTKRGIDDRDDRLDYCANVIGRTIISSKELTADEASALFDALEQTLLEQQPAVEQPQLGDQFVTRERAEILQWARRESRVTDAWMRTKLEQIGIENVPEKVTLATLKTLTPTQGDELHRALSDAIDARPNDE